jgi:ring-1,2-phenylacetyl-CoA epoxidase subunit PaaD
MHSSQEIWAILSEIPDPEIPVISIAELGMLREVKVNDQGIEVFLTPTYSGCPATKMIEDEVRMKLSEHGIHQATITHVLSPAWTTDWLSEEAREKLRKYGIAPPEDATASKAILTGKANPNPACPQCGSKHTQIINQFGSTACKALYKCLDCLEPFDYFKCI